jgi:putative hydrolase of the HAD superfamily
VAVRAVLLDLGGVVCRFRPERRLAALAAASGLEPDEVQARVWGSGLDERLDAGGLSAAEAHRAVSDALGAPLDPGALSAAWVLAFEPDAAVLAVVDHVRRHVPTGLLTDNGPTLLEALPHYLPEVAARFDWLLFSCALGARKPAPEVFERAAARVGAAPGEVLLVDDAPANVAGARAAGLGALLYAGPAGLSEALARAGVAGAGSG